EIAPGTRFGASPESAPAQPPARKRIDPGYRPLGVVGDGSKLFGHRAPSNDSRPGESSREPALSVGRQPCQSFGCTGLSVTVVLADSSPCFSSCRVVFLLRISRAGRLRGGSGEYAPSLAKKNQYSRIAGIAPATGGGSLRFNALSRGNAQ